MTALILTLFKKCNPLHSPLTSSLAEYSPTVRTKTIWGNLQQKKFVEDFFKYLWTLFNMYIIYQFKNCPIKLEFVSSKNLNCNFTDFDGSELRRSTKILVIMYLSDNALIKYIIFAQIFIYSFFKFAAKMTENGGDMTN